MEEIIQAMDLSYQYMNEDEESVLVLDHLNITVPKGQFLSVLGHNGSGKSTFAKHLNAILLPCGGKVYVWPGWIPPVRKKHWRCAAMWAWYFRIPTIRL